MPDERYTPVSVAWTKNPDREPRTMIASIADRLGIPGVRVVSPQGNRGNGEITYFVPPGFSVEDVAQLRRAVEREFTG